MKKLSITLVIIVLLQILLAFQGFDVCDDGFVLTFYQQIFSSPESVEYNFLYWFSGFIGGLWYLLYEDGGIIWFRLLGVIVNTLTFYLSYILLKQYLKQNFLLLALVMVLFVNDFGFLTYYHNQLTAMMTVLIIYFLVKAVDKNNKFLFVISGILLSVNIFTRIPNIVLFSLLLVVPYSCYLKKEPLLNIIKPILYSVLGAIVGVLMIYLLLNFLGQLEIMKNALFTIKDLGNTENSSHNFKSVFMSPYYNYKSIVRETLKLSLILFGFFFAKQALPTSRIIEIGLYLVVSALFVVWFDTKNIYPIYSLCLIGSISTFFVKKINRKVKVIGFLSFLTLITITLGTGGGIKNSGYMAIWVGLPLFFHVFIDFSIFRSVFFSKINIPKESVQWLLYLIVFTFLSLKAYNISQEAYFDKGSRFEKIYAINHPLAKSVYTTERRAKILNNLLLNLNEFVKPNDYLMVYDKIPMLHFLTETKPYMYNSWVWIYDYNSFEKKITKAEREIPILPIVVQQKFETFYDFSVPILDYMSTEKENTNSHSNERNAIMNSFLERNEYEVVWSDNYFNIYQSKQMKKK